MTRTEEKLIATGRLWVSRPLLKFLEHLHFEVAGSWAQDSEADRLSLSAAVSVKIVVCIDLKRMVGSIVGRFAGQGAKMAMQI